MRSLSSLFSARIGPVRNRWVLSCVYAGFILIICLGFSNIAARVAAGVFGQPLHPVRFWVTTFLVLALFIWFLFWLFRQLLSLFRDRQ
jgi:hypothetical protein